MPKIIPWTEETAKIELKKRLDYSRQARQTLENTWIDNERTIYFQYGKSPSAESSNFLATEEIDSADSDMAVSFAFKNLRFLHAQLSANPPTVIPSPTSNDQDDRRKADAADRLVHHALRAYTMQENVDQASLNTLLYGTGFLKTVWDSNRGEPLEFDPETGELVLEGDIGISIPSPWKMLLDPDCTTWKECRYVFEEHVVPFEEAVFRWPEAKGLLQRLRQQSGTHKHNIDTERESELRKDYKDVVRVFEYWERGLPTNGYVGRHCFCTAQGELISEVRANPFRFPKAGILSSINDNDDMSEEEKEARIKRLPQIAGLPYHIFTDIDVPQSIWGKSFVEYISELQDLLNRLDSTTLDNVQAHGVARLVLPEGAEISDDSITNSAWDYVKVTGSQTPHFFEVPKLMPEMDTMRAYMKQGIDDMSGVNEAMFGQQSREQSGFSMQYATNQGNMIRRRLFNKYVMFVESIYEAYLNLVRKHWDIPRMVKVLGNERQIESIEIKGADIDGGFDLVVEYGSSLSLDPMTRREEIMALQPLFEKAGVPPRILLGMMKLNELSNMRDIIRLAEDRQREIFEQIIATGEQVQPRKHQDHVNMMAYAETWFMTKEFDILDEDTKALCEEHIELRAQAEAQKRQPPQPPGAPGPDGNQAPLPAPGLEAAGLPGPLAGATAPEMIPGG